MDIYRRSCSGLGQTRWFLKIRREKTQTYIQTFLKCFSPVEEREGPAGRLSCAAFIHLRCERVIMSHSRCQDLGYHPGSRDTVGGRHPGEDKSPTCASLSDNSRVSVFIQKLLSGKEAGFCQLRQNTCFFFFFLSLIFFFQWIYILRSKAGAWILEHYNEMENCQCHWSDWKISKMTLNLWNVMRLKPKFQRGFLAKVWLEPLLTEPGGAGSSRGTSTLRLLGEI